MELSVLCVAHRISRIVVAEYVKIVIWRNSRILEFLLWILKDDTKKESLENINNETNNLDLILKILNFIFIIEMSVGFGMFDCFRKIKNNIWYERLLQSKIDKQS